jgi:folate-binding protein YgfZ
LANKLYLGERMEIGFVRVKGKECRDFLHRVSAGAVKSLGTGQGSRNALFTGQSRMIAHFDALCLSAEEFLLATPLPLVARLADALEALHFAEDLEIGALPEVGGVWRRDGANDAGEGDFAWERGGEAIRWPAGVPGWGFCSKPTGEVEVFAGEWNYARIAALLPWYPGDYDENTPALEAAMLPRIDRAKGCYPGQEVVEKSLNVGHPARVLVAYEREAATNAPQAGERLAFAEGGEGLVTSAAFYAGRARALVRVPWAKKDFAPTGWVKVNSHW